MVNTLMLNLKAVRYLLIQFASLFIFSIAFCSEVAITIDDFNLKDNPLFSLKETDEKILASLEKNHLKAALFVTTKFLNKKSNRNRLSQWDQAGHIIANHTHNHKNYHETTFKAFSLDVLRADMLLKNYKNFRRFFRFPMLKAGNTIQKRDQIRKFLQDHGYKNGYVTIDASDWYIHMRLIQQLKKSPKTDLTPYRNYYLNHIWEQSQYHSKLAKEVLKREIKHTLLIHHNLLNALFLDDLIQMYKKKGWKIINASEAFSDPVFKLQPNVIPTGESIVWSLAKETGKFDHILRYPGQDSKYEKKKMDKLGL